MSWALAAAALCGLPQGWSTRHLGERTLRVYRPSRVATPVRLVLEFHGRGSNTAQQRLLSRLDDEADSREFLIVQPEGIGGEWNAGPCCGKADDVGFVKQILEKFDCAERVYAVGMSNGGLLAQRLACDLPGRFKAIATVAGAVPFDDCSSANVPLLIIHGDDDPVLPFEGAVRSEAQWAARNHCGSARTEGQCSVRTGCTAAVEFCRVRGGGHTWPGGPPLPGLGAVGRELDATSLIAAFFARH